jgi:hypothetical protein
MPERAVRKFIGYDLFRNRPFLYDYGFWSYLFKNETAGSGKTL